MTFGEDGELCEGEIMRIWVSEQKVNNNMKNKSAI